MEAIEITFLKKDLFKLVSIYSYNQILNDLVRTKDRTSSELIISEQDYEWFLKVVNRADGVIQRKISHLLDHEEMLKMLKLKITQKTEPSEIENEVLTYAVRLSHTMQLYLLSDAIEEALIAEIFKIWCKEHNIMVSEEHLQTLDNLRSISLMINTRAYKPYNIN